MSRTVQLLGPEKVEILRDAHVLVAGLGGVGAMTAEMLVRAGIGNLTIVDNDSIATTNINRQLPAAHSTVGLSKVKLVEVRLRDINPELHIYGMQSYINEDNLESVFSRKYDFVADAIDTLTPKILLIEHTVRLGVPLVSSMGSGGKTDPSKISITDFGKTYNCKLAYLLRKKLRKMGVTGGFKAVFSSELADKSTLKIGENMPNKKSIPGTISYIPAIFGCMLASVVVGGLTAE